MRYFNLLLVFALISCKSVDITNANKSLIKKGNKLGVNFIEYSVLLDAEKEFIVDDITIDGSSEKIKFYYKNLNTGASSYDMLNPLPKGKYSFNFKVNETENFVKEEFLILEYRIGKTKYSKRIPIKKNESKSIRM